MINEVERYYKQMEKNEWDKFYLTLYMLFLSCVNLVYASMLENMMILIFSAIIAATSILAMFYFSYQLKYVISLSKSLNTEE